MLNRNILLKSKKKTKKNKKSIAKLPKIKTENIKIKVSSKY